MIYCGAPETPLSVRQGAGRDEEHHNDCESHHVCRLCSGVAPSIRHAARRVKGKGI